MDGQGQYQEAWPCMADAREGGLGGDRVCVLFSVFIVEAAGEGRERK